MDVSTEMVANVLPLFLANALGARTLVIGFIEGVAESTSGLMKLFSGALSDRVGNRKWLAVSGYALSALAKPGFAVAGSWGAVAAARWGDRLGKGVRTAPRDALLADSVTVAQRGLAFGLHRTLDTVLWKSQATRHRACRGCDDRPGFGFQLGVSPRSRALVARGALRCHVRAMDRS